MSLALAALLAFKPLTRFTVRGLLITTTLLAAVLGDANVDGADFLLWQRQAGSAPPGSQAIPESASIVVASIALLSLLSYCRGSK